jgi:hypothetical protein
MWSIEEKENIHLDLLQLLYLDFEFRTYNDYLRNFMIANQMRQFFVKSNSRTCLWS